MTFPPSPSLKGVPSGREVSAWVGVYLGRKDFNSRPFRGGLGWGF